MISLYFSFVGSIKSKKRDANGAAKLPLLLKPTSEDCPTFEVEEQSDGKLTILPIGPKAANAKKLLSKKTAQPIDFAHFQDNVSSGFFALLHVFKYLSIKERLKASRVCKLWHQISQHTYLWNQVIIKDCRVQDWKSLRDQCNRYGVKKLDLKKMPSTPNESQIWTNFSHQFINALTTLTALELPKITASSLQEIVESAHASPITNLKSKKM